MKLAAQKISDSGSAGMSRAIDGVSSISAIIPSAVKHDHVTTTLRSLMLAAERSPLPTEVIFVANGKNAWSKKVETIPVQFPTISVVRNSKSGKNRALNLGLSQASGALIVFLDDDVIITPNYFSNLLEGIREFRQAKIFAGPVRLSWPDTHKNILDKSIVAYAGSYVFAHIDLGDTAHTSVFNPLESNFAIRRTDLNALIPLDEESGPANGLYRMFSGEVLFRSARELGYVFAWLPELSVEHIVREEQLEPGWIWRRCFRWGRAADFFDYSFRSISGTDSGVRLLATLAVRTLRIAYFWAMRKNVPFYWAVMDHATVLGIFYERAVRLFGALRHPGSWRSL